MSNVKARAKMFSSGNNKDLEKNLIPKKSSKPTSYQSSSSKPSSYKSSNSKPANYQS